MSVCLSVCPAFFLFLFLSFLVLSFFRQFLLPFFLSFSFLLFILSFVLSFPFLAHLSRRLIGELIDTNGPASVVRRPSSVVCPQCSNIFFSETAWPIKAKFYMEPPWIGGTKFCSWRLGHMTKMAATPIYGKNPSKIFFSRTGRLISTKLGM